jgi:hypothetical protein
MHATTRSGRIWRAAAKCGRGSDNHPQRRRPAARPRRTCARAVWENVIGDLRRDDIPLNWAEIATGLRPSAQI